VRIKRIVELMESGRVDSQLFWKAGGIAQEAACEARA
jgi:hypothetical protein